MQGTESPPVSSTDFGVYIHFPYCTRKCPYCDFNSHTGEYDDTAYADAIIRELDARANDYAKDARRLRSLYFGGGTPSLWHPREVRRVIRHIETIWPIAKNAEVTLEANPESVEADKMQAYVEGGVNRFSIGAQSFRNTELKQLGRIHNGNRSVHAVRMAQAAGARVSLDLIYALPEQTTPALKASLAQALELGPQHISAYTLTIEPKTVLATHTRLGLFQPMEDDRVADYIDIVTETLQDAGYTRYEVSNYAQHQHEAIHNTLYWAGGTYLGLGAGAHSYLPEPDLHRGIRRENFRRPEHYIAATQEPDVPAQSEEPLKLGDLLRDRIFSSLRTRWGIDFAQLEKECGRTDLQEAVASAVDALIHSGLLRRAGTRIQPTPRGFRYNDAIARQMFDALDGWKDCA